MGRQCDFYHGTGVERREVLCQVRRQEVVQQWTTLKRDVYKACHKKK